MMDSEGRKRSELKGSLWPLNPLTPLPIKEKNLIVDLHTYPAGSVCQKQRNMSCSLQREKILRMKASKTAHHWGYG